MKHLYNSTFEVYRSVPVKDRYNRPTGMELQKVGEYRGRLSRERGEVRKSIVNSEAVISGILFTDVEADIQVKDIIKINGMTFIVDFPHNVDNHHLEVDLITEFEV